MLRRHAVSSLPCGNVHRPCRLLRWGRCPTLPSCCRVARQSPPTSVRFRYVPGFASRPSGPHLTVAPCPSASTSDWSTVCGRTSTSKSPRLPGVGQPCETSCFTGLSAYLNSVEVHFASDGINSSRSPSIPAQVEITSRPGCRQCQWSARRESTCRMGTQPAGCNCTSRLTSPSEGDRRTTVNDGPMSRHRLLRPPHQTARNAHLCDVREHLRQRFRAVRHSRSATAST